MIITVTPAPGLDRTYTAAEFGPGRVNRAGSSEVEASGKGVNVSRALALHGSATVAVLPLGGPEGRQLAGMLAGEAVPFLAVETEVATRTNITLAIAGQPTTKMNAPSPALPESVWTDLVAMVADLLGQHPGAWVLCAGSVPAGADRVPARLVELSRRQGARSAVDSSGAALTAALDAAPDLIAPNHLELAELVGADPAGLDPDGHDPAGLDPAGLDPAGRDSDGSASATTNLVDLAGSWARTLAARTGGAVLATLGAAGAIYADATGSWHALAPPIVPVNTVGAGDALLAGFLSVAGSNTPGHPADNDGALATAVAWGTAACAMAGTSGNVALGADVAAVKITQLS